MGMRNARNVDSKHIGCVSDVSITILPVNNASIRRDSDIMDMANILQKIIIRILSVAAKKPVKKEVGKQKSTIKITIIDIPETLLERIWHYWLPGVLTAVLTFWICLRTMSI